MTAFELDIAEVTVTSITHLLGAWQSMIARSHATPILRVSIGMDPQEPDGYAPRFSKRPLARRPTPAYRLPYSMVRYAVTPG